MRSKPSRNNPQIWRLAEFTANKIGFIVGATWISYGTQDRNKAYDFAAELLKKISNNEFTGPDNHKD